MKKFACLLLLIALLPQCHFAQTVAPELYYLVREPKVKVKNPPLIILLHGLGSNEADLFSLAPHLPDSFLVVSARAPFTISEGSYRWYDLRFVGGKPVSDAEQAEKSRNTLIRFIEQLKSKHKFNDKAVYLCGFSQGAIMSFSVGLSQPDKIKGIIALSGRVLNEAKSHFAEKNKFDRFKVLIIHGTEDKVLPITDGRESKKLMEEMNIKHEYHELPIGHSVNNETLRLMNLWLNKMNW